MRRRIELASMLSKRQLVVAIDPGRACGGAHEPGQRALRDGAAEPGEVAPNERDDFLVRELVPEAVCGEDDEAEARF